MSIRYNYWYWRDLFSTEKIKELHNIINEKYDKNAVDKVGSNSTKTCKVKLINWSDVKKQLNFLEQKLLEVNSEHFGFNLWPQYDSYKISLNEYDSVNKGEYSWHRDSSVNHVFDYKFTMLINLSLEPYEGGHFYLFDPNGGEHVKVLDKPGSAIAFISNNFHKVTPVTSGKRHSLTIFYSGPRFI
tara:strand:+ start:45 stop:602 length:558 start_codon:yes stop_codon:yes gene_type:complete